MGSLRQIVPCGGDDLGGEFSTGRMGNLQPELTFATKPNSPPRRPPAHPTALSAWPVILIRRSSWHRSE